jgi:hypothetical protein
MANPEPNSKLNVLHPPDVQRSLPVILLACIALCFLFPAPAGALSGNIVSGLPAVGDTTGFDLSILCKNMETGAGIAGARVYVDGGYPGLISEPDGHGALSSLSRGEHSIRVVKRGFIEQIIAVHIPEEKEAIISLHPAKIIPVGDHGPVEERMDIVFVPSKTQYDCTKKEIVPTDYYTSNEENFRRDVDMLISKRMSAINSMTSEPPYPPKNAMDYYNFYYYSDPGDYADAFSGCAGTLPEDFRKDAPFADVAIIVYPTYKGTYMGPPCEPNGCSSSMGPGINSWFKIPADSGSVFIHEAGHSLFGLIDTYCGETYYTENDPKPNVWNSQSACTLAATSNNWDPLQCRQIALEAKPGKMAACQKDFWRYDPDPDIMGNSLFAGKFGKAATLHIHYMLDNINRWAR